MTAITDRRDKGVPLEKNDYVMLAEFRHALRRFLHVAEKGAREAGLTPQQHQLLLATIGRPGRDWATIGELAEALRIRHPGAVGLVNRCARAGLVRRVPDEHDRRQVRVELTERGHDILAQVTERNRSELSILRKALNLPFLDSSNE